MIVVITGASSGIGRATAQELARGGASLVLAARRLQVLQDVAAECMAAGAQAVLVVPTDMADASMVKALAKKARERFNGIDVWINNASVGLFARFEGSPPDVFRQVMETNFFGYVNGARAVLPVFRAQKRGTLINIVSLVASAPQPYASAYVASKFAVHGWAESLRMELSLEKGHQIRVCNLHPPATDTPFFRNAANYSGRTPKPLHPIYTPRRVAKAIASLALHPKPEVFVGRIARAMTASRAFSKRLYERVDAPYAARDHFTDTPAAPTEGTVFHPRDGEASVEGGWRRTPPRQRLLVFAGALAAAGVAVTVRKRASR